MWCAMMCVSVLLYGSSAWKSNFNHDTRCLLDQGHLRPSCGLPQLRSGRRRSRTNAILTRNIFGSKRLKYSEGCYTCVRKVGTGL